MLTDDVLLTPEKVADVLGISRSLVYKWINEGKLPAIRLGDKVIRIRQGDLDVWIAAQRKPTATTVTCA